MITKELEAAFAAAVREARRNRHEMVCLEHVLWALLRDRLAAEILVACGGDLDELRRGLEEFFKNLDSVPLGKKATFEQSVGVTRVLQRAAVHAQSSGKKEIDAGDILAAMFKERDSTAVYLMQKQGITRLDLLDYISHGFAKIDDGEVGGRPTESPDGEPDDDEEDDSEGPGGRPGPAANRDPLASFATDLVARAAEGKIDPLIGRTDEIERMIHVLCRRRKNNPILVGESGVGKTAIAEGLALAIAEKKVPEPLLGAEVFALDMGGLIAGTKFRGEFEQRLKGVINALRKRPGAILFIDEIHTIVGAGSVSGGTLDASNILKPALASGELRCIGSTTYKDYQQSFERDRALARRFQKIEIKETSIEDTVKILQGLRKHYEDFHFVRFTEEAIRLAAELSSRHLTDRQLPDKAIDVIDEAGASARLRPAAEARELPAEAPAPTEGTGPTPAAPPPRLRRAVDGHDIETIIAKMARIPPRTVSRSDKERLQTLERDLKLVIYGQDPAIESLVSAIKLSRSGLGSAIRPVGSFLFSGPTGVGKTELARQLARSLGVELLRFDMSEYMEKHTVSRLIGAPPGYVGFDQGGLLTDAVLRNPWAVLLLDEIEKAHPDVFNILLQVMDHATLTDNNGRKADFRNVTLVMTTNAGAGELAAAGIGFGAMEKGADGRKAIERTFTPEFRNRLDAWIAFGPLAPENIVQVVDKLVAELEEQLRAKSVNLDLTDEARSWLARKGYDKINGARPMARLIDRSIRRKIADELLFGTLQSGGEVTIDVRDDDLAFTLTPRGGVPVKHEEAEA
jgi:ATP-dependent Clp protease ATP-binding subunit ClpA